MLKLNKSKNCGDLILRSFLTPVWLADFIFEYAELKADYFNQSFESILNDSLLGLTVVTIGLVIWLVILLIKDPDGVFEKKFTKK